MEALLGKGWVIFVCLLLLKKRPDWVYSQYLINYFLNLDFLPPPHPPKRPSVRQSQEQLLLGQYYSRYFDVCTFAESDVQEWLWGWQEIEVKYYSRILFASQINHSRVPAMFSFQSHKCTLNKNWNPSIRMVGKEYFWGKNVISYLKKKKRQERIIPNLRFGTGKTLTSRPLKK